MSISGPSALGTLLVQRLDAMLGTSLSQQANVVSGARPDAVTQPGQPERPEAARNETIRDTRTGVDRALEQSRQHGKQAVDRALLDAKTAALLGSRGLVSTTATPSAPTSLGLAARAILALLANHPDLNPATLGKAPLINHKPGMPLATMPGGQRTDATAAQGGRPAANASTLAGSSNAPAASAATTTGSVIPTPGLAGQLIQILPQILQTSGMFYESHLNGLMAGKLTLEQLQQEPQAQAGRTAGNTAGNPTSTTQNTPGASTPTGGSEANTTARNDASSSTSNTPATANTGNQAPVPGVDPQAQMLVRQQLEVLANQTFAWRGEAWPDAPMEWEVSRHETPAEDQQEGSAAPHWATKITIHLPQLGDVQARLTLSGQQLVMHVIAPESASLLGEHTEELRRRCLGQGLQLSQLSIADHDNDHKVSHDDTTARA